MQTSDCRLSLAFVCNATILELRCTLAYTHHNSIYIDYTGMSDDPEGSKGPAMQIAGPSNAPSDDIRQETRTAAPRYVAPFFPLGAQPEISELLCSVAFAAPAYS